MRYYRRHIYILLLSICAFASSNLYAQPITDADSVKADNNFLSACKNSRDVDEFGVSKICNSQNEIEVRLVGYALPGGDRSSVVLTFNKGNWDVKKYSYKAGGPWDAITTTKIIPESDSMKNLVLQMLFNQLKDSGIFTLPGQGSLGLRETIHDGAAYQISYKAGNKYRRYTCTNMEGYLEEHRELTELRKYIAIVRIFYSILN